MITYAFHYPKLLRIRTSLFDFIKGMMAQGDLLIRMLKKCLTIFSFRARYYLIISMICFFVRCNNDHDKDKHR